MFIHLSLKQSTLHAVHTGLYYGDLAAGHSRQIAGAVIVHACKDPCHKEAVRYQKHLSPEHPDYVYAERGGDLYLNMIDPPLPLFRVDTFTQFLEFTDRHFGKAPVVIHCNQGLSRAPSLALLYMAKRLMTLPNESYAAAKKAFEMRYPYSPGAGIATFLSERWSELG